MKRVHMKGRRMTTAPSACIQARRCLKSNLIVHIHVARPQVRYMVSKLRPHMKLTQIRSVPLAWKCEHNLRGLGPKYMSLYMCIVTLLIKAKFAPILDVNFYTSLLGLELLGQNLLQLWRNYVKFEISLVRHVKHDYIFVLFPPKYFRWYSITINFNKNNESFTLLLFLKAINADSRKCQSVSEN